MALSNIATGLHKDAFAKQQQQLKVVRRQSNERYEFVVEKGKYSQE